MARVRSEESSGRERRNQSGKRLKAFTRDLSENIYKISDNFECFYQKGRAVSSFPENEKRI
jgi:hypothetical protein